MIEKYRESDDQYERTARFRLVTEMWGLGGFGTTRYEWQISGRAATLSP
jgi:hypothetical protein